VEAGSQSEAGQPAVTGQPGEAGHQAETDQPASAGQPAETGQPAATGQPAQAGHQAEAGRQAEAGHQAEAERGKGGHEAASPWALVGRLFNFAILAGGLVYLLKSRFADYLRNRAVRIRSDLAKAKEMREEASAQLASIEERLKALPSELEALKRRGAAEVAAEQARMRAATEAERQRMIGQARREVDAQVRNAERMLLKRAGELAVNVASERVRRTITDADQARLVDRYLVQVGSREVRAGN